MRLRAPDFASHSKARRVYGNRIVFTCHYCLFGCFRCFPPHLAVTQLLQLLASATDTDGLGLPPKKRCTA